MHFNTHYELTGKHAFLSASKYHWVNYDDEKLDKTYMTHQAARRGTELHELAFDLIRLGVKLPRTEKTLNMYVNDALGFRMQPEQMLVYSDNAFGTADAISFKRRLLRIHDLKTGIGKASMKQLEVYAAFFCLEYRIKPGEIEIELRLYQNDSVEIHNPSVDDILHIMDRIITFDNRINILRAEAGL